MSDRFRITLAQLNPIVGDLAGNADKAFAAWEAGKEAGANLVALPEMFIAGYNAQDLVLNICFTSRAMEVVKELAGRCAEGPALTIGAPWLEDEAIYNAYLVLKNGKISSRQFKHNLPNEGVFDELRVFDIGPLGGPCVVDDVRIGSPICEDAWHVDVAETLAETGAELLLVPNGSPYARGKNAERQNHMVARVIETGLPLIYLNMVGGQDDQVFDGGSFALNPGGALAMQMPLFDEAISHIDMFVEDEGWRIQSSDLASLGDSFAQDYQAMTYALRDYLAKSGFSKVLLGLSGGIDSALVASIAVDALGAENVRCVMLPSEYTSQASLDDAEELAKNLGVQYDFVPIKAGREAITETLAPLFANRAPDLTEENIQSRLRGLLLMAMSNKFGEMLLTTGNKSEIAVGYATIYGDMSGGYNPIKDLYKTRVFEMCTWRNTEHFDWMRGTAGAIIPQNIITKPPSAELRPDQKDSDSLPDYPVLDAILSILVDEDGCVADCVAAGYSHQDASQVERLLYLSEYKRFQSAPGVKLSKRAFWLDRRYPIVNHWKSM